MKKLYSFLFIAFYAIIHSQVNLSANLTACYALNGSATDAINNLNGTVAAVTATVDRNNNPSSAMEFAGTNNSVILLPNSPFLKPASDISVSGWFRMTALNYMVPVFAKNTSSSFFTAYSLVIEPAGGGYKFRAYRQNGSNSNIATSTTLLQINTWYHVVFCISASTMQIYVNGSLEGSSAAVINSFNYDPAKGVVLGGTNESVSSGPFKGTIDNVRFYDRIINASEVLALYQQDPVCLSVASPTASMLLSQAVLCAGDQLNITDLSSGGPTTWTYTVTGPATMTSNLQNPTFVLPVAGVYTITQVCSSPSGTATASANVTVVPLPNVSISAGPPPYCDGSTVTLTASGAQSYSWFNGGVAATTTVLAAAQTNYSVIGTGTNGCQKAATVQLATVPQPTLSVIPNNTLLCIGMLKTYTVSGAQTYTWSNQTTGANFTLMPAAPGTVAVTGTGANGCTASSKIVYSVRDCVAGVSEEVSHLLTAYPVPFKEEIFISNLKVGAVVELAGLTGQVLMSACTQGEMVVIDAKNLAPGIYILRTEYKGLSTCRKVIKE